jgi:hypothetical protein
LEDGLNVPEALPCLCLDRLAVHFSRYGVEWTLAHEDNRPPSPLDYIRSMTSVLYRCG